MLKELLQEALDYEAEAFDTDQPINGSDLVEWFAAWRERVALAIANMRLHPEGGDPAKGPPA